MPRHILRKRTKADKARYYIDSEEYTKEIMEFKKNGRASERMGELWKLHVDKCGSAACFKGYTYLDEMKGKAILFLVQYSHKFNPEKQIKEGKKPNAFYYCTTIIHNAFLQVLNKEKRNTQLKERLANAQRELMVNIEYLKKDNHKIIEED